MTAAVIESSKLERRISPVIRYPKTCLAVCLLIVVLFGSQLLHLQTDPTTYMLDKSHPARMIDSDMEHVFTATGATISIVISPLSGTVYEVETLQLIDLLTARFERMNLVSQADAAALEKYRIDAKSDAAISALLDNGPRAGDKQAISDLNDYLALEWKPYSDVDRLFFKRLMNDVDPVARVRSLANVEDIRNEDDVLEIEKLMVRMPETPEELSWLARQVEDNPLVLGAFVSEEHKATSIQIELRVPHDDSSTVMKAHQAVDEILQTVDSRYSVYVGGSSIITNALSHFIKQDNDRFFPFVLLVIVAILALSFRTFEGVYVPLVVAVASLVCTLGLLPLFGLKQNIVTTMIPIFIMATAVADSIHFLNHFYKACAENGQQRGLAIMSTYRNLFRPLLFTSITTMFGFLALAYTEISFIREFGIFIAAGIVIAFLFTITLLPAMLILRSPRKAVAVKAASSSFFMRGVEQFSRMLNRLLTGYRSMTLAVIALLFMGSAFFAKDIQVDFEGIAFYPEESKLRQDDSAIRAHFKGIIPLSIRLDGEAEGVIRSSAVLEYIEKVERLLKANPNVGYILSPNAYFNRMNQVLNQGEKDRLPESLSDDLAAQLFLLYDNSSGQDIRDVVDTNYRYGRIVVLLTTDRSSVIKEVVEQLNSIPVPEQVKVGLAGHAGITMAATEEIVHGQINSMAITSVVILLIMGLLFKSLTLGVIATAPLVLTLLLNFGIMGLLGLDLDVATSLIAAIVFGIGIDYSIHYIESVKFYLGQGCGKPEALQKALAGVSPPILVNSLCLAGGFAVLVISSFQPLIYLGALIAMTMIVSALSTLVLLPLLLSYAPLKLKD